MLWLVDEDPAALENEWVVSPIDSILTIVKERLLKEDIVVLKLYVIIILVGIQRSDISKAFTTEKLNLLIRGATHFHYLKTTTTKKSIEIINESGVKAIQLLSKHFVNEVLESGFKLRAESSGSNDWGQYLGLNFMQ